MRLSLCALRGSPGLYSSEAPHPCGTGGSHETRDHADPSVARYCVEKQAPVTGRRPQPTGCGRADATEAGDSAHESFAVGMSDIEALVALTVGVVRVRRRWQDVRPALRLRCEEFVDCANAEDNSPAWQADNGHPWVSAFAPCTGEDDDYND